MILKSFVVEKDIKFCSHILPFFFYGENIGLKDELKKGIKVYIRILNIIVLNKMMF